MFSELVDDVVRRTNRPDFLLDIVKYANSVIRTVHHCEVFYRDLKEVEVIVNDGMGDNPQTYVWDRPADFRLLSTVKYLGHWLNPKESFPPNIPPGIGQSNRDRFYYAVGDKFVFYDKLGINRIGISYLTKPKTFKYYPENERPAVYNRVDGTWKYLVVNPDGTKSYVDTLGDPALELAAQDLVADWLIRDYDDMLSSGISTKIFSILQDPRNKVEYSTFKEALRYARTAEKYESTGEIGYNR